MAKKYTTAEILDMAVGLIEKDMAADNNLDGKITAEDARYQKRLDEGLLPMDTEALMAENVLNKIIKNTGEYSYDVNSDGLYAEYKSLYEQQGKRASEDAMGLASALTGGYASSYAQSVAAGQRQKYDEMLADKRAQLEENAYRRYEDSLESLYSLYNILSSADKTQAEKKKASLDFALKAMEMGDSSYLKALGIDVSDDGFSSERDRAEFYAKYGDYSLIENLGVDISSLSEEELLELGEIYARYGDYSVLKSLGINTANKETEDYYDRLIKKSKIW